MARRYLNQTFENIMNRMLDKVPNDIDKREGSIIYDALAPACAELVELYIQLDNVLELAFTETSNDKWLEMRCKEQGIYREEAIKAQREGIFNIEIPIGMRFGIDNLIFITKEEVSISDNKKYIMECETAGVIGNEPVGTLIPLTYIEGLETATLGEIIVPGAEKENDKSLYLRYKEKVEKPPTSGNIYHYTKWANEVDGVGAAKVIPTWNGPNTVKVLIVNTDMQPIAENPSVETLVDKAQQYIDPGITGLGEGKAPIGAKCTVESALSETINISATINGVEVSSVLNLFIDKVNEYFKTIIRQNWQAGNNYSVSYAMIGSLLLDSISIVGGIDYSNLLVNGGTANVPISDKVPTIGTVTLS